jgi:hypothetical protein
MNQIIIFAVVTVVMMMAMRMGRRPSAILAAIRVKKDR